MGVYIRSVFRSQIVPVCTSPYTRAVCQTRSTGREVPPVALASYFEPGRKWSSGTVSRSKQPAGRGGDAVRSMACV